ncbi:MAG: beta-ketoacyl-[acyl-carrier-protein] synthase family protein [Flavobacteriales bacterium]|nr:beta-ketoacyl-[acyl-carrier-protein] synthase family protein [Flavobacteriales bacterium]
MSISITGLGIVSAIGMNLDENLNALQNLRSGISTIELINGLKKSFLGGEIKLTNRELSLIAFGKDQKEVLPRSLLLSLIAAKQAWGENNINPKIKTVIIGATTVGGMDLVEKIPEKYKRIRALVQSPSCVITDYLADYFHLDGFKTTISTACSSSANAIILGSRMIKNGLADRVLVGGGDALTKFTVNGFDSLRIYDTELCKPFDNNRKGLNLGEAAAYIVLENNKSMTITKNKKVASVIGWGNANDAYHQTASSPEGEGAQKSMQLALEEANLSLTDIDYINAHGTATPNNDLSEGRAIEKLFGPKQLFSSTKAYTGHTLAAAGVVECIYSILSIKNNTIFPTLNHNILMPELKIKPVINIKENTTINTVLSNSFGFGGNNATIIIGK